MSAHEIHNQLASDFVQRVLRETSTEAEAMVVLESIMLAAMLFFRPNPFEAGEFLDLLTANVIARLPAAGTSNKKTEG